MAEIGLVNDPERRRARMLDLASETLGSLRCVRVFRLSGESDYRPVMTPNQAGAPSNKNK